MKVNIIVFLIFFIRQQFMINILEILERFIMNKKHRLLAIGLASFLAVSAGIVVPTVVAETKKSSDVNSSISSGVVGVDNSITNKAISNIENAFKDMSLENYRIYFSGANNAPETNNKGRMTPDILSNISGIPVEAIQPNGIKVSKASDTADGYLIVNISIELNNPYTYNGANSIQINNVTTGMYDPNSEFNLSLFEISGDSLNGFTSAGLKYTGTLYVPNVVNFVFLGNNYFDSNVPSSKIISFEYSKFINFSTDFQQFINSPFQKISFKNNEYFNTFNNWGMFQSSSSLEEVDFENCVSLQSLYDKTFLYCSKLTKLNFKNCKSLTSIGIQVFYDCSSLEVLDFSDSPITSVGDGAFIGCTNLKEIIVQKESVQYFEAAVQSSNINAKVIGV